MQVRTVHGDGGGGTQVRLRLRVRARPRARGQGRALAGVLALLGSLVLLGGTAHADETNKHSHNGPRVALINAGQIDDPMEDVLEHFLLFGDGYLWD